MVELSIIIPTFNEEEYLPRLLESIKKQNYKKYEIIVADANSKDNTINIAKKHKCKIVKGGKPARGRNNGVKISKGRYLLFMDADGMLPNNSLDKLIKEFKNKDLDVASVYLSPLDGDILDDFLYFLWDIWERIMQYIDPYLTGAFLLCKKNTFKKIGGFDESLSVGEDHGFARVADAKGFKVRILRKAKVGTSARRFKKEGRYLMSSKFLFWAFHRSYFGEVRSKSIGYKWK